MVQSHSNYNNDNYDTRRGKMNLRTLIHVSLQMNGCYVTDNRCSLRQQTKQRVFQQFYNCECGFIVFQTAFNYLTLKLKSACTSKNFHES